MAYIQWKRQVELCNNNTQNIQYSTVNQQNQDGEYRVGIKFNDQHVPDSPYKVYVTPALEEARKIEIGQFPDSCNAVSNKPLAFIVQKNGAKGHLDAKVISPSGAEDDCFLALIDDETYSVRFLPKENGIHMIHVRLNGIHIPGSPFRIRIGHDEADPAVVSCSGAGLKDVKTGHKNTFLVDTCNAGAGTLAVTIDGPSKVSMDCIEVDDGYEICYTPLAPGDYYAVVKYNGYHIAGSPFKIKCTGEAVAETGDQETSSIVVQTICKQGKGGKQTGPILPKFNSDATKVTCKGMGLKKAYMGKQNQFTVNAQPAGNNILFVGVYGPKSPMEEVSIKHTGRNNYNVSYVVKDRGEHILIVKWGEDHIPGSPFRVEV